MKKVFYLAGTRADFSPMQLVLDKINKNKQLELCIYFLNFIQDEEKNKKWFADFVTQFRAHQMSLPLKGKDRTEIVHASEILMRTITEKIQQFNPDIVLILGDRFEQFILAYIAFSLVSQSITSTVARHLEALMTIIAGLFRIFLVDILFHAMKQKRVYISFWGLVRNKYI